LQKFHQLKISNIKEETTSAVAITFDIPSHLTELFSFKSGQYITLNTFPNVS